MSEEAMKPLTEGELSEIGGRAEAATFGPWEWCGNTDTHDIHLATVTGGRVFVLGFRRWGMQQAGPEFQGPVKMLPAHEIVKYQVAPVVGSANRGDKRLYRADFRGLDHPDASFIEHSREDIPRLLADLRQCHKLMRDARDALIEYEPNDVMTEVLTKHLAQVEEE